MWTLLSHTVNSRVSRGSFVLSPYISLRRYIGGEHILLLLLGGDLRQRSMFHVVVSILEGCLDVVLVGMQD